MFRPAMVIIRFYRKRFRRCYTVSVTAYWWGDLVISVPLFKGSFMISGGSMWKRGGGRSAVLSLGTIQPSFWGGGFGSICAHSPGLLFPLSVPLGQFLLGSCDRKDYVNKIPMIPSGIKPETFRFVVQRLNHCAIALNNCITFLSIKFYGERI